MVQALEEVGERGGLALHALSAGTDEATHGGMRFFYWTERMVHDVVPDGPELIEAALYAGMEPDDSLLLVFRRG